MPLPAEAYTHGERFQLEKRRLFAKAWLPFCAAGQIAAAGQFVNHSIGGWPIFAIRGADGTARAFRNLCRHQGMPVVEQPAGHCDRLRCRYHGWTYDHTGTLVEAPPLVAPADPGAPMHHLDALTAREADGMVLVRGRGVDAAPAPEFGIGDAAYLAAVTTDLDANWKAAIEVLLAGAVWRLVWPIALVGEFGAMRVVRQIVPRSFSRTRLVDLLFGARDADPTAAVASARQPAEHAKLAAQALQARRAAGDESTDAPEVTAFHAQLVAVCGA
jgi:nitrite reductase/ring-hydroxylating ferredoxin subunit